MIHSSIVIDDIGNIIAIGIGDMPTIVEGYQSIPLDFAENKELFIGSNCENYCYDLANSTVNLKTVQSTAIDKSTITADGIDAVLITNIPSGIFTAINTSTGNVITGAISGSDTFATTIAGTYHLTVTSFSYLDFNATVEAV